jgi:hypothetical protein
MRVKAKSNRRQRYETIKLRGFLEYQLRDAVTGEIVRRGKKHNTVTYSGRNWAMTRILNTTVAGNMLSALAFGSVSTQPQPTDTQMAGFMFISNFASTTFNPGNASGPAQFSAAMSFAGSQASLFPQPLAEFGIYNGSATNSATLFNRYNTSPPIPFTSTNSFAITVTLLA